MKAKAELEGEEYVPYVFKGEPPSLAAAVQANYKGTIDLNILIANDAFSKID